MNPFIFHARWSPTFSEVPIESLPLTGDSAYLRTGQFDRWPAPGAAVMSMLQLAGL